jgi:transposase
MWKPYLDLIEQHCTNTLNIQDRFHIVAKMNLALDDGTPPKRDGWRRLATSRC